MAEAFQKLGNDRMSQNIKRAVSTNAGGIVTGDIARGEAVVVKFGDQKTPPGATDASTAEVGSRRTGAFPIAFDQANPATAAGVRWFISDGTLDVLLTTGINGTITFWVF